MSFKMDQFLTLEQSRVFDALLETVRSSDNTPHTYARDAAVKPQPRPQPKPQIGK